jgi:hypothetical protein
MFLRKLFGLKPIEVIQLIKELKDAVDYVDPIALSDPLLIQNIYAKNLRINKKS